MFPAFGALLLQGIALLTLLAAAFALVDCARRRADAFPAVGRRSKQLWLGLTGGAAVVALLNVSLRGNPVGILGIAAIVISGIYLLDIRPRIQEITGQR